MVTFVTDERLSEIRQAIITFSNVIRQEPPETFEQAPPEHREGIRDAYMQAYKAFEEHNTVEEVAEILHLKWYADRKEQGWEWGDTIDRAAKIHPAMMFRWAALWPEYKVKGLIFALAVSSDYESERLRKLGETAATGK
jgi:hypothetical protein